METAKNQLLDQIHQVLTGYPDGLKEYDLLIILKEMELPVFSNENLSDSLDMFRAHFMLFHLLYCLRERLFERKSGSIEIHCLQIILQPWQEPEDNLPSQVDSLRDYYLDMNNLEEISKADVDLMIETFWQDYCRFHQKPESYEVLGLPTSASPGEIKRRYHKLALKHHPDQGGKNEDFRKISQAASVLLG